VQKKRKRKSKTSKRGNREHEEGMTIAMTTKKEKNRENFEIIDKILLKNCLFIDKKGNLSVL
jgi:hypothetical protein